MIIDDGIRFDLMKVDGRGRVWLTTIGTRRDLDRLGIRLREGLPLKLWSDDVAAAGNPDNLLVEGVAHFYEERGVWVAHRFRQRPTSV